jgi:hypothetical protein
MPKYLPTPYPHKNESHEALSRKDSIDSTVYCPSTYSELIRRTSIDSDPGSVMKELLEYNRSSEISHKNHSPNSSNSNTYINSSNNVPNQQIDLKEVSLKIKITELLQNVTKRYMKNQQNILNAKQVTMDRLKQVDTNFEKQREILQNNFRINQEKLQRRFQENLEKSRLNAESSRTQYQDNLDRLNELSVKNQKDYFESQENILMHYRKVAKKRMK